MEDRSKGSSGRACKPDGTLLGKIWGKKAYKHECFSTQLVHLAVQKPMVAFEVMKKRFREDVSVRLFVSCQPMDSAAVRKLALLRNPRIYAYLQLPEAFRRLLRTFLVSGCLG
ncbi:60S ribosomal protein L16 [Striga asiatica]|uniref:60S ribosomal protein L16 n=1 Tax=Striga asiatica TaxID=4170 RepID=A0A5A7QVE0_STRAF|nr:60S ribosomal protein L16 [Striga asiatica]